VPVSPRYSVKRSPITWSGNSVPGLSLAAIKIGCHDERSSFSAGRSGPVDVKSTAGLLFLDARMDSGAHENRLRRAAAIRHSGASDASRSPARVESYPF